MPRFGLLLVSALLLAPFAAHAAAPAPAKVPAAPVKASPALSARAPDLISIGGGYYDFDKDEPRTQSGDIRAEYRFGYSLWSASNSWLDFQIHPLIALEFGTLSQTYGAGGFAFDLLLWDHLVLTESETVGLYQPGDAKSLGSFVEFRSQIELGWRFDNNVRVTAQVSHISNAGITQRNPGAEIAGIYVHIPACAIVGCR